MEYVAKNQPFTKKGKEKEREKKKLTLFMFSCLSNSCFALFKV